MKKIIKSRIFIVIICGIIFTSLGVYGATKYQASEVLYNPINGDSMTVNDALNDLYDNINTGDLIIDLGTGRSFDIKELAPNVDYESLTVDNFIVEPISSTKNYGWYNDGNKICKGYKSAYISVIKSYSNGILTVSVTGGASVSPGDDGTFSAKMQSTSSVKAYLIIN